MPLIHFYDADVNSNIRSKKKIKQFLPFLFLEENKILQSLTLILCSDDYLLKLNKQFLNHDYYTDILTFDLSTNKKITGEIYISIDRVKENILVHNVSYQEEIKRIIFHGVLHLCGYKDGSSSQKKLISLKEDEALVKYNSFHVKL